MDITKLLNWSYLIERYPEGGFSLIVRIALYGLFALVIITAITLGIRKKHVKTGRQKLFGKIQTWGWTFAVVGLLLAYFREVRAIYLSSRLWMLVWLVISLIWLIIIIKYWKFDLPKKEKMALSENEYNKWLPKPKS